MRFQFCIQLVDIRIHFIKCFVFGIILFGVFFHKAVTYHSTKKHEWTSLEMDDFDISDSLDSHGRKYYLGRAIRFNVCPQQYAVSQECEMLSSEVLISGLCHTL